MPESKTKPLDPPAAESRPVAIPLDSGVLEGELALPRRPGGLIIFAHGMGTNRRSRRDHIIAHRLQVAGFGTLLFDLLTREERDEDAVSSCWRRDIDLLTRHLLAATQWAERDERTRRLGLGCFGVSLGAAACLELAAELRPVIRAIVTRGARFDEAMAALPKVTTPTLLIVGEKDGAVLDLNRQALARLAGPKELAIIPGADHLFEAPGSLEEAAGLAAEWYDKFLSAA